MDAEARQRLRAYADLIRAWSERLDLVAPGDLDQLESRHIDDSLRLLPLLEELPPGPCIDVGSGAGLPGIPLAIAGDRAWRLLEPRRRRAAFLEEAVRALDLPCEVLALTAQEAAAEKGLASAHPCAVARALAPPTRAFELLGPLVAPGGRAVVFAGRDALLPPKAEMWREGLATMPR